MVYIWNSLTEQLIEYDVYEIRTGKSIKKMFWAAFRHDKYMELILLTSDRLSQGGGITVIVIREIYMNQLLELLWIRNIFMHDNAPVYTAYIIKNLL